MAVDLNYRYFGREENPTFIVMHGLLGSSRNWITAGRALSKQFDVSALDLRNHGNSPHAPEVAYEAMADDLLHWMDKRSLRQAIICGHSLGGKVAMRFACEHPDRVIALVVADIAPRSYPTHLKTEFDALSAVEIDQIESRKEAEATLESRGIDDWATRQFLLSNLVRGSDGRFSWQANVPVLAEGCATISANSLDEGHTFSGPTLFIRGAQSSYIRDEDSALLARYFPNYILSTVSGAGHNVHFDNLEGFIRSLLYFWNNSVAVESA